MLKKLAAFMMKRLPRRRHLRGSFLHRALGERLFDNDIWKMNRHSVAGGLAIGIIIAFTPTLGLHMLLAGMTAYILRVNIPVALLACWVSNPITAPVIYPLQYRLGVWLLCTRKLAWNTTHAGLFGNLVHYAWPLWIGSLVSGFILAAIAYCTVFFTWDRIMSFKDKVDKK